MDIKGIHSPNNFGERMQMKEKTFERRTFCLDIKLKDKVMNIEANLIKETKKHWSNSKVINYLIRYALDKGADTDAIAKMDKDEKK